MRQGAEDLTPSVWPCVSSDWLSLLVTYVSILILPVAAATSLIARLSRWADPKSVISSVATAILVLSGVSALRCLAFIRRKLETQR